MLAVAGRSSAADWPTFGGDNGRSRVTGERLALPLAESWVYRAAPPLPAWPDPARADLFRRKYDITQPVTFDRGLQVAVADGAVYFGSSADDKVTCLAAAGLFPTYGVFPCAVDADNGTLRWQKKLEGLSPQGYMMASATAGQESGW